MCFVSRQLCWKFIRVFTTSNFWFSLFMLNRFVPNIRRKNRTQTWKRARQSSSTSCDDVMWCHVMRTSFSRVLLPRQDRTHHALRRYASRLRVHAATWHSANPERNAFSTSASGAASRRVRDARRYSPGGATSHVCSTSESRMSETPLNVVDVK